MASQCGGSDCGHKSIRRDFMAGVAFLHGQYFAPRYRRNEHASLDVYKRQHIYGMYDLLGPRTAYACRSLGVPYVLEPMGMFRPIVRNIALKRLYHSIWGKRMARGARHIIATSPMEAAELTAERIPRDQIVVRRNGIEMPITMPTAGKFRARWKIPPDAVVILFPVSYTHLGRGEARHIRRIGIEPAHRRATRHTPPSIRCV